MTDDPRRSNEPEKGSERPDEDPLEKLNRRGPGAAVTGAGQYAGLGLQFVISILVFLYLGNALDGRLGTGPLFLVLGVFLGAGAAFYSMYRKVMADEREEARRAAERKRNAE